MYNFNTTIILYDSTDVTERANYTCAVIWLCSLLSSLQHGIAYAGNNMRKQPSPDPVDPVCDYYHCCVQHNDYTMPKEFITAFYLHVHVVPWL